MRKNREVWDTNRHMTRRARLGKFWCFGCDCCLIGAGAKCPVCGHRPEQKRDKKR